MKRRAALGVMTGLVATVLGTVSRAEGPETLLRPPLAGGGGRSAAKVVNALALLAIFATLISLLQLMSGLGRNAERATRGHHDRWVAIGKLAENFLGFIGVFIVLVNSFSRLPGRRQDPAFGEGQRFGTMSRNNANQARRETVNYGRMSQQTWRLIDDYDAGVGSINDWALGEKKAADGIVRDNRADVTAASRNQARQKSDPFKTELAMYGTEVRQLETGLRSSAARIDRYLTFDERMDRLIQKEAEEFNRGFRALGTDRWGVDAAYRATTLKGLQLGYRTSENLWQQRTDNWKMIRDETRNFDGMINRANTLRRSVAGKSARFAPVSGLRISF